VTNLSPEICRKIKRARREAGLSQTEVALEVGCKQSALSMFEQGDGTKLGEEMVERLAKKFGIDLSAPVGDAEKTSEPRVSGVGRGFCPNPHCPTNRVYVVEGRRFLLPDIAAADPAGGRFCAMCGEVIEKACPNCGAAVHEGAICSFCGKPYVSA